MGIIETVKDVATLIQKADNIDLVRRMAELQTQVYDLVGENRDLKEANRDLVQKLSTREQMVFRKNAYWNGDDGPFCPQCYDAESKVMRMLVSVRYQPRCPKCQTVAIDPDRYAPIGLPSPYIPASPWG